MTKVEWIAEDVAYTSFKTALVIYDSCRFTAVCDLQPMSRTHAAVGLLDSGKSRLIKTISYSNAYRLSLEFGYAVV